MAGPRSEPRWSSRRERPRRRRPSGRGAGAGWHGPAGLILTRPFWTCLSSLCRRVSRSRPEGSHLPAGPGGYLARRRPRYRSRVRWPGCGAVVATEGICVVGGELPGPAEEIVDDLELVVGIGRQQLAGAVDEAAKNLLIAGGGGLGGVHDLAAAVTGIGLAADIASPLEAIEDRGDAAGSEAEQAGQGGGGQRAGLADDVQGAHVGPVQAVPVGGHLVEAVDLGAQRAEAGGDLAWQHPPSHSLPI